MNARLKDCDLFQIMQINITLWFKDYEIKCKLYTPKFLLHAVCDINQLHLKILMHFTCARSCWNISVANALLLSYVYIVYNHELSFIWLWVAMKSSFMHQQRHDDVDWTVLHVLLRSLR